MSTLEIVLIVLAVLVILLFVGGMIAVSRRADALEDQLQARLASVNEALADAHAADKGWERETIETAARTAFADRHSGVAIQELHLVQVIDKPGVDADEAVFHVVTADGTHTITLGRAGGTWAAV